MPIEFKCTACETLMRATDDAAGKMAKCPTCGELVSIPQATWGEAGNPYGGVASTESAQQANGNPFGERPVGENPYAEDPTTTAPVNPYSASQSSNQIYMSPMMAHSKVQPPAVLMLIFSSLLVLSNLAGTATQVAMLTGPDEIPMVIISIVLLIGNAVTVWGAICMLRMKRRGWAIAGCISGMIFGFGCCFIPSAFALWGFIVIQDSNVKVFFD